MKKIKKCTFFESKEPLQEALPKSHPVSIGYYFFFLEENPAQEQIYATCNEVHSYLASSHTGKGLLA